MSLENNFRGDAGYIAEDLFASDGELKSRCQAITKAVKEGYFSISETLALYEVSELQYAAYLLLAKNQLEYNDKSVQLIESLRLVNEIFEPFISTSTTIHSTHLSSHLHVPSMSSFYEKERITGISIEMPPIKRVKYKAGIGSNDSMLKEFFQDELKDIYWAEKYVLKTLPKFQEAATSTELQDAFTNHTEQSKIQVERLEQIFELLGKSAQAKKCEAMEGIVEEGKSMIEDTEKGTATRDVGLILAAQKIEHYKISTYGGLNQIATTLGLLEVGNLLKQTLEEKKRIDVLLSNIAKDGVNYKTNEE